MMQNDKTRINFLYLKMFNTLTATAIFRKLAKNRQFDFFHISEYEITRSLAP